VTRNRILLCLMLPFLYPWRLLQSRIGFPVDMGEFHREIGWQWRNK
jgi:hypothetical protein